MWCDVVWPVLSTSLELHGNHGIRLGASSGWTGLAWTAHVPHGAFAEIRETFTGPPGELSQDLHKNMLFKFHNTVL